VTRSLESVLRRLLTITSRNGRPGTILTLQHGGGRHLYLEAAMPPMSIVLALEREDVEQLVAAAADWLVEQDELRALPAEPGPISLVAGAIARGSIGAGTVQLRTVPRDS
jgi:hypothetical protein